MNAQMTYNRLDLKRLKREAKRLGRSQNIPHNEAIEVVARKYGFRHWGEVTKAVKILDEGCVFAFMGIELDTTDNEALVSLGFEPTPHFYENMTADLLERERKSIVELRASGWLKPEDENRDVRARFQSANPLYGATFYGCHPDSRAMPESFEALLEKLDAMFSDLNVRQIGPEFSIPLIRPSFIWLKGKRHDIGFGGVPGLPPELDYSEQELNETF